MGLGISAHAPAKVLSAKVPVMGEGWGEVEEEIRPHCAAMSQLPVLATLIISGEDDQGPKIPQLTKQTKMQWSLFTVCTLKYIHLGKTAGCHLTLTWLIM